jgi:hypothetical protein
MKLLLLFLCLQFKTVSVATAWLVLRMQMVKAAKKMKALRNFIHDLKLRYLLERQQQCKMHTKFGKAEEL